MIRGLFKNTVGAKIARGEMTMDEYLQKVMDSEFGNSAGYRAIWQKSRIETLEEVLERMDEGVCFMCEHESDECFKNCTHEYETMKKWLKEKLKEQKNE